MSSLSLKISPPVTSLPYSLSLLGRRSRLRGSRGGGCAAADEPGGKRSGGASWEALVAAGESGGARPRRPLRAPTTSALAPVGRRPDCLRPSLPSVAVLGSPLAVPTASALADDGGSPSPRQLPPPHPRQVSSLTTPPAPELPLLPTTFVRHCPRVPLRRPNYLHPCR